MPNESASARPRVPANEMPDRAGVADLRGFGSHPVFILSLLAVAVLAAFWPVLRCGFINYDDPTYVSANPHVMAGLTWRGAAWAFTTGHASNWHPLTWLSHMLDVQLFGLNPGAHHFINLLFHLANTLLLFGLFQRLGAAPWRSAFLAALFGLHPLQVESVAWVSERKNLLSAFFLLLAVRAYVNYACGIRSGRATRTSHPQGERYPWFCTASRFCFLFWD